MIALVVLAVAGPALRLGSPMPDGAPVVHALDARGRIAARITCPRSQWSQPEDMAARLIGSRELLATVIAKDGRLTTLEDLGQARHECVLLPPGTAR